MSWQLVGASTEMDGGRAVCLPWKEDSELAMFRRGNELVAFDNLCHHRGARIFNSLHNQVPEGGPACRYHGRKVQVEDDRRKWVGTVGGLLFAGETEHSYPRFLYDGLSDLALFVSEVPNLRLVHATSYVLDCHWTTAVENALDFEHVPHVHASSLGKLGLRTQGFSAHNDGSTLEKFAIDPVVRERTIKLTGMVLPDFEYAHAHIFPYACLSSTMGLSYSLQNYFPRADGKTNFVHRLYAPEMSDLPPWFFKKVAALNDQVFIEDALVCALVKHGTAERLGPSDARILNFRKYLP